MNHMDRIGVMKDSLRCFGFGLASLIPVLGVPMALLALYFFVRARTTAGEEWNAAEPYLKGGRALACAGLVLTLLLLSLATVVVLIKIAANSGGGF
jgi:hypothetical protein